MKVKAKKEFTEKYYGVTSKEYDRLEHRQKKVLEIFSNYNFNRILDVGCGDGNYSLLLKDASNAKEVYGIDITEKCIKAAKKKGINAYLVDIDEEDFPFEDEYFDAICAGEIIEHLYDTDHFLDEVYRTLKRGGLMVLTTPNLASIHNRIALLFGYQPFPTGVSLRYNVGKMYGPGKDTQPLSLDHIRVFTLRSLKSLLEMHSFEILSIAGSCAHLSNSMKFDKLFGYLDNFLSKFPSISYGVIVTAKRMK